VHVQGLIGVGIITYNTAGLLLQCIHSLVEANAIPLTQIVVIDSASTDNTEEQMYHNYPDIYYHKLTENNGYAYAVNMAASFMQTEYMLIINADTLFLPQSIERLLRIAQSMADGGVWGMQQIYPDKSWQRSYGFLPSVGVTFADGFFLLPLYHRWLALCLRYIPKKKPFVVDYVDGAVLLLKRAPFMQIQGFDERFFFYGEEAEYCVRMQRNTLCKAYMVPSEKVIHFRGQSSQNSGDINEVFLRHLFCGTLRCAATYSTPKTLYQIRFWEIVFSEWKQKLFFLLSRVHSKSGFYKKYLYYKMKKEIWISLRSFIDELCHTK